MLDLDNGLKDSRRAEDFGSPIRTIFYSFTAILLGMGLAWLGNPPNVSLGDTLVVQAFRGRGPDRSAYSVRDDEGAKCYLTLSLMTHGILSVTEITPVEVVMHWYGPYTSKIHNCGSDTSITASQEDAAKIFAGWRK